MQQILLTMTLIFTLLSNVFAQDTTIDTQKAEK